MVTTKEFFFPSSDGRTQIHAVSWTPEGEIAGIFQIAHGLGEHALRYAPFAEYLAGEGFLVVANDHIGHGKSVAEGAAPMYFGEEKGWSHVVDDMRALQSMTRAGRRGLPYYLLGHSMGSFLARTFLIRYPGSVSGAIIMGTGQQNPQTVAFGAAFARREGKKLGFDRVSPAIERLAFGSYNKPFAPNRTPYDWLSVNPENVDRFIADPLCGGQATTGLIRDMLGGIRFQSRRGNLSRMDKNAPVLFLSGADDPVGEFGRGAARAYLSFVRAGVRDAELKLYAGMRHEILNETEKERVYSDILAWLEKQRKAAVR